MELYTIKKQGAFYCVLTVHSGIVQFRSTNRRYCVGWIEDNTKPRRIGSDER